MLPDSVSNHQFDYEYKQQYSSLAEVIVWYVLEGKIALKVWFGLNVSLNTGYAQPHIG